MIARITRGSAHTALAISLASLPLAVSATAYAKDQVQPEPSAASARGNGDIVVTAMRREQRKAAGMPFQALTSTSFQKA